MRFHPDVAPFLAPPRDAEKWDDAAELAGPGGTVIVRAMPPVEPPPGWEVVRDMPGVQMVPDDAVPTPVVENAAVVELGAPDVDEMLALVGRTKPGGGEDADCGLVPAGLGRRLRGRRDELSDPARAEVDTDLTPSSYRAAEDLAEHLGEAPVFVVPVLRGAADSTDKGSARRSTARSSSCWSPPARTASAAS